MQIYVGNKVYNFRGGPLRNIVYAIIVVIVLVSGLYSVGADEVGVIQRFGKFVRRTNPGLHLIREEARKSGWRSLQETGLAKVVQGITSLRELVRVTK